MVISTEFLDYPDKTISFEKRQVVALERIARALEKLCGDDE